MRLGTFAGANAGGAFFRNPVITETTRDTEKWLYSTFEFTGKSGNERTLEFGGELIEKGKDLIIEASLYIKNLPNDQAAKELGRERLNALKEEIRNIGKDKGFERVIIDYTRSAGSSSKNPGSSGQWTINVNQ